MAKEIELRGVLTEKQYSKNTKLFESIATSIHISNKTSYFFVNKSLILKVVYEKIISEAFLVLKLGDETNSILEEYNLPIKVSDIESIINMLCLLGYNEVNKVEQERTDYIVESIQISIKRTKDWGPHFEIECLENQLSDNERINKLRSFAEKYTLNIMSADDIRKKIKQINKIHNFKNGAIE